MEQIVLYKDEIFDDLFLASPTRLQGGAYFSKLFLGENKPIIFQTPKSSTKNGLIVSKKKTYCDLLFTTENQKFIQLFHSMILRRLKKEVMSLLLIV